jgi:hypothetical protein
MGRKSNYPNACGKCSKPTHGPKKSRCNCIKAPDGFILSDAGPKIGEQGFMFNVFEVTGWDLPDGCSVCLGDSSSYFTNVSMDDEGNVLLDMNSVNQESGYVEYQIKEDDGVRSSTGCITINTCPNCDDPNDGCCDPVTGDSVIIDDLYQEINCGDSVTFDLSGWDFDSLLLTQMPPCASWEVIGDELTVSSGSCGAGTYITACIVGFKGKAKCKRELQIKILDLCADVEDENVNCNPCTGEWITTQGGQDTAPAGDINPRGIPSTTNSSQSPGLYTYSNLIPVTNSHLVSAVSQNSITGALSYTPVACGVGTAKYQYTASLPDGTSDIGFFEIFVNNPPANCMKCEDGVEVPAGSGGNIIYYDDELLMNVSIDADGNLVYDPICSDKLPATTTVKAEVWECDELVPKDFEIEVPCFDGCATCQGCDSCDGQCDGSCGSGYTQDASCGNGCGCLVPCSDTPPTTEPRPPGEDDCDKLNYYPKPEHVCKGREVLAHNGCGDCITIIGMYEPDCPKPANFPKGQTIYNDCGVPCGEGIADVSEECCITELKVTTNGCDGNDLSIRIEIFALSTANLEYKINGRPWEDVTHRDFLYSIAGLEEGDFVAVEVRDKENPSCNKISTFTAYSCDCEDLDVEVVSQNCDEGGNGLEVVINFSGTNIEGSKDGVNWVPVNSGDTWIFGDSIEGSTVRYWLRDIDNPNCIFSDNILVESDCSDKNA